jgi:site-specific recombinase XerD
MPRPKTKKQRSRNSKSTALALRTSPLPALLGREVPKYFTPDEVQRILAVVEPNGTQTPEKRRVAFRNRLILNLLWQTGLRVSELLALTPQHVDFYAQVLAAPTLKRRKQHTRFIPLKAGLLGDLARYVAEEKVPGEERLFPVNRFRIYQIVKEACQKAGIDDDRAHPHTFRHSFAVNCVRGGVPVLVLNEWLGHANVENTLVYTKVLAADSRQFYERVEF